jgi:hypothetical protein
VRLAKALVPCALLLTAAPARADEESNVLDDRHRKYESPQHFALEFRFGAYKPNVDDAPELGGKTPFADTFGTPGVKDSANVRLEIATEFDWQMMRIPHLGTLGPGISIGYTSISRPAALKQCPPPPAACVSGEDTTLEIFPMYGVLVLRADVVTRELHIPLVPYVKGGVGLAFWRASNTLGTSSATDASGNDVSGKGHTWGTHVALGVALHLNDFDQGAARNLDNSMGINHTYAFFELMSARLTGLGQKEALFVGTNTWVLGLAFEM